MKPQNEQNDPRETYVEQAVEGIKALSPADKSWIAGFVIIFAILVGSNAYVQIRTLEAERERGTNTLTYMDLIEQNRSNEIRRSQETIKALADAVARDSERAGMAAMSAIDERARRSYAQQPDFIGPPEAPQ